jgi:hypothetical protein
MPRYISHTAGVYNIPDDVHRGARALSRFWRGISTSSSVSRKQGKTRTRIRNNIQQHLSRTSHRLIQSRRYHPSRPKQYDLHLGGLLARYCYCVKFPSLEPGIRSPRRGRNSPLSTYARGSSNSRCCLILMPVSGVAGRWPSDHRRGMPNTDRTTDDIPQRSSSSPASSELHWTNVRR